MGCHGVAVRECALVAFVNEGGNVCVGAYDVCLHNFVCQ